MARPKSSDQKIYLYIRVLLIIVQVLEIIGCVFISFLVKQYWLRTENLQLFTLFLLFPAAVQVYQIKIIREEYYRYVPTMWLHKLYWGINLLMQIAIVALLFVQLRQAKLKPDAGLSTSSINWIFSLITFLTNGIQMLFALVKKQDRPEFEDYSCFSFDIPNFLSNISLNNVR